MITIPTIHPAAILHGGGMGKATSSANPSALLVPIWSDLRRAAKIARDGVCWTRPITILPPADLVYEAAERWLDEGVTLAVDIETDGLDVRRNRLRCIGFGTAGQVFCLPWGKEIPGEYLGEWERAAAILKHLLASTKVGKIGHNFVLFDAPVLRRLVGPVENVVGDTMLLHNSIHPDEPQGLGWVAAKYLDVHAWKQKEDRHGRDTEGKELWEYCMSDVLVTARLWPHLLDDATEAGVGAAFRIDMAMGRIAAEMRERGVPIHLKTRVDLVGELKGITKESEATFQKSAVEACADFDFESTTRKTCKDCSGQGEVVKGPYSKCKTCKGTGSVLGPEGAEETCLECQGSGRFGTVRACKACSGKGYRLERSLELLRDAHSGIPRRVKCEVCKGEKETKKDCKSCGCKGYTVEQGINPDSPLQLSALLFRVKGLASKRKSKGGTLQATDEEALLEYMGDPLVSSLIEYREATKFVGTFLAAEPEVDPSIPGWGWLHPEFRVGLVTGRWACRPYIMSWPERVRCIVKAPPGSKIVGADMSALELRIMAGLAGAKRLLQAIIEGRDLHSERAARVFGKTWEAASPEVRKGKLRKAIKVITYASLYGGSSKTVLQVARRESGETWITEQHVIKAVRDFEAENPEIPRFRREMNDKARRNFELRSPFLGRRRVIPWPERIDPTMPPNFPIQSGAADVMNWILESAEKPLRDADDTCWPPWLQQHDAIYLLAREEKAESVCRTLVEIMRTEVKLADGSTLLLEAEGKVMDVWH